MLQRTKGCARVGRDNLGTYQMARKATAETGGPVIIKKYANRRLYNTQSSKYITLDFLAELTRKDVEFQVVDAKTGEDITHSVLTQIIMEEENGGKSMLPVNFLRQIIALYGDSMQGLVPQFLESSMDNFRKNQKQVQDAIETALTSGPFGHIAKQNIEMMKAARDALVPNLGGLGGKKEKAGEDLDDLKKQMAELQAKIDKLNKE
jgi:polyhydroxyalkanoate synthesis repressor PhaR